jgi:hypothetical protein
LAPEEDEPAESGVVAAERDMPSPSGLPLADIVTERKGGDGQVDEAEQLKQNGKLTQQNERGIAHIGTHRWPASSKTCGLADCRNFVGEVSRSFEPTRISAIDF